MLCVDLLSVLVFLLLIQLVMSTYLPPASVRIKRDSSDSLNVSHLRVLMAKIPILTPVSASSAVAALNLLCRHKRQRTLQLAPLALLKLSRLVTDLELVPLSRNKPYFSPSIDFFDGTTRRNARGAITEVLSIDDKPYFKKRIKVRVSPARDFGCQAKHTYSLVILMLTRTLLNFK